MQQDITVLAQFYKLVAWFEDNRKEAAIGAAVLVAAALAVGYYVWSKAEKDVSASEALSQVLVRSSLVPGAAATAADGYKQVAEDFAGTRAAGRALLAAGSELFTQGKYDDSLVLFRRLMQEYPNSDMLAQAQYGIAACLDAQGKADDAYAAYQRVISSFPNSDVVAQSKFASARILEAQGKLADAMNLYEEVVRTYGLNNTVGSEAGMRGDEVKRRMSMSGNAPVVPAAVTPTFSPSDFTRSLTNLMSNTNKP